MHATHRTMVIHSHAKHSMTKMSKDKQEAHGPHRSPEKTAHDYIITLTKRRKKNIINIIIIFCFFHLKKLESSLPRMPCAKID